MKRLILSIISFSSATMLYSQALRVGVHVNTTPQYNFAWRSAGVQLEYEPNFKLPDFISISFATDPMIVYMKQELNYTQSLSTRFNFGDEHIRISPILGGHIRSNGYVGWNTGVSVSYNFPEGITVFVQGTGFGDYYRSNNNVEYIHFATSWFGLGAKLNLIKPNI